MAIFDFSPPFETLQRIKVPTCIYCGDHFQCRDHPIPVNYSQVYRDYKRGHTVKSCRECNGALGDKPYFTIPDRAGYLLEWYEKHRKKHLCFPHWDQDEIDELGYVLKTSVMQRCYLKELYLAKIQNLQLTKYGFDPKPIYEEKAVGGSRIVRLDEEDKL